jgi:hypothetical protein
MRGFNRAAIFLAAIAFSDVASAVGVYAEWGGSTVYVRVDSTPSSPEYTCTFSFVTYFADGTNVTNNDRQADPATGLTKGVIGTYPMGKTVSRVQMTAQNCSPR